MRKIELIDTHVHYNVDPLVNDYDAYIKDDLANNIFLNIIGTDLDDCKKAIEIAKKYPNTVCSIAYHPNNIESIETIVGIIEQLEQMYLANKDKVIAIGECGIDYFFDRHHFKKEQEQLLIRHIELAIKYQLPIILHVRDSHDDTIKVLKKYYKQLPSIIVHCYTGSLEHALIYQEMGCYISFSGIITFKKSDELRKIAKTIRQDLILSETDGPYLSPEPLRGKINTSKNIIHTNQCIANVLGLDIETTNKLLLANATKALKLDIRDIVKE